MKDFENKYRDVGGYDMSYDEHKQLCERPWEEDYNYLCIDGSKKRDQGRYCICDGSENFYIEGTPETKPFSITKMLYSNRNRDDLKSLEELVSL